MSPLAITLTEPAVFVRRGNDAPVAVVRGILTLSLTQSTRIQRIEVTLEGKAKLQWTGTPKRPAVYETRTILNAKTTLFSEGMSGDRSQNKSSNKPSTSGFGFMLKRPQSASSEASSASSPSDRSATEFRAGVYNYPIAFTLPNDCPPSIYCANGTIKYRLKASVHKSGSLSRAWTTSAEVQVVSRLTADVEQMGFDCEGMALVVERRWSDSLVYRLSMPTTLCPVESSIPFSLRLLPIAAVKLYRITIRVEEHTVYDAKSPRGTYDEVRKYQLLRLKQSHALEVPLLPLPSNINPLLSPLNPFLEEPDSEKGCQLRSLTGPWNFLIPLQLPCGLQITNKQPEGNICVTHKLVLTLTLQSEKRPEARMFDVNIDMGLTVLSAHFRKAPMFLPAYSASQDLDQDAFAYRALGLELYRCRTEQFVRLSSGQENSAGELSPPYTRSDASRHTQPESCHSNG